MGLDLFTFEPLMGLVVRVVFLLHWAFEGGDVDLVSQFYRNSKFCGICPFDVTLRPHEVTFLTGLTHLFFFLDIIMELWN